MVENSFFAVQLELFELSSGQCVSPSWPQLRPSPSRTFSWVWSLLLLPLTVVQEGVSAGQQVEVFPEVLEKPEQPPLWILQQAAWRQRSADAEAERHQSACKLVELDENSMQTDTDSRV